MSESEGYRGCFMNCTRAVLGERDGNSEKGWSFPRPMQAACTSDLRAAARAGRATPLAVVVKQTFHGTPKSIISGYQI